MPYAQNTSSKRHPDYNIYGALHLQLTETAMLYSGSSEIHNLVTANTGAKTRFNTNIRHMF